MQDYNEVATHHPVLQHRTVPCTPKAVSTTWETFKYLFTDWENDNHSHANPNIVITCYEPHD